MPLTNNNAKTPRLKRVASLAVVSATIAVVWLSVLPWIATQPRMKARLDWLDDQGIDPSAMYYTELEVMEEILLRQRARERAQR